jgi:hypothetical protein
LGFEYEKQKWKLALKRVDNLGSIQKISAGSQHSAALTMEGSFYYFDFDFDFLLFHILCFHFIIRRRICLGQKCGI